MSLKNYLTCALLMITCLQLRAKDYRTSLFGIHSDGITLNTRSIQYAIDFISQNGGGRLVFNVGRYLTGSIHLKSNVTLHLEEGAVLLGSLNPWDYDKKVWTAIVFAHDQQNIGITGQGVIDGRGRYIARNIVDMIHKGLIKDLFRQDRPEAETRPVLAYIRNCENVNIKGVTMQNSSSWVQIYDQCKNVVIDSITVDSKAYWNNDGIDIVDCDGVSITNSFIDSDDDGICLKSHDASKVCKNVLIRNCTIRSSANGIKFGTASYGGFSNVKIYNVKIFDTYRSAVTLQAVDGGFVENVIVDSLKAYNTGNAIFLRIGERIKGRKGRMENVHISHMYVEVPATKPDAGYEYEGPIEDMPRNISPSGIVGMPDALINNVTLKNIEIRMPGGGNPMFAKVGLDELDKVPEKPTFYPEFSMFDELPAWGLYMRHAKDIKISNLTLTCEKKDYRTAIVTDDVHGTMFESIKVTQPGVATPGVAKNYIHTYKSTGIVTKK